MATSEASTAREQLFEAIQATAVTDDDIESSVLTGFLVIAEWTSPAGERWLSKVSGDHTASLPAWRERGFAAEVLHDFWPSNADESDDDKDE